MEPDSPSLSTPAESGSFCSQLQNPKFSDLWWLYLLRWRRDFLLRGWWEAT